ncbi:conserved membrane hypothetical protein [uncultured Desulfatiglans sp.]|uniref:Uncharacterized protein n=1 Tax=Uncultured Desulfatiglans sp. TaxID=1748965 RepID=A0A653AD56_UNCDX|nr:conserved membrane hypothetical protein [uncultured Desulfatiglans sp.]
MVESKLFQAADLSMEVVILLFGGMAMLILGILLFPVYAGVLPYYENGLFGLLLVIFAFQIVAMGKTPFGDFKRNGPVMFCGITVAAVGIVTCFIPDLLGNVPRMLLTLLFGVGGLFLLLQMVLVKDKARLWRTYGGIFNYLIVACCTVYLVQILIAVLIFKPNLVPGSLVASAALLYGLALVYLACVLQKISRRHPPAGQASDSATGLSLDNAMLLMMGVFMLLLGLLLLPVNLGLIPFSPSAQLGLLMVLFGIQMLAVGSTPIGAFERSWLVILLGFVFGGLGIVSCIIPGILVVALTFMVGVLNIAGGIVTIAKVSLPLLKERKSGGPIPPIRIKIDSALLLMNILTILFGTTMLVSNLIPGLILGAILAANGCVLLYLLYQLETLRKVQRQEVPA